MQRTSGILIIFWLFFGATLLHGQGLTSPAAALAAFREPPKLIIGLDSKRSIISNRDVKLLGIRAGLDFDDKARLGFGIYFLSKGFERNFIIPDEVGGQDTIRSRLRFNYMSVWYEYVLLRTKRWEVSLPLHIGLGEAEFQGFEQKTNTPILLGELSVTAYYKIFPWLGISGGFGYRQTLAGNKSVRENFDAPIWNFGVKLFMGWIIKKVFPDL